MVSTYVTYVNKHVCIYIYVQVCRWSAVFIQNIDWATTPSGWVYEYYVVRRISMLMCVCVRACVGVFMQTMSLQVWWLFIVKYVAVVAALVMLKPVIDLD